MFVFRQIHLKRTVVSLSACIGGVLTRGENEQAENPKKQHMEIQDSTK
jgi:hypothetical protein